MRRVWLPLALAACAAQAPPPPSSPAPEPAAPPVAAIPALPPGVLARVDGRHGLVEVVERDGLRMLLVAGVVQGAVPLAGAPLLGDPLVALVRAARPHARRALVIGLGTGRTADELVAAGLEVEVLELEPAVVDLAREHFGYTGHAEVGDGFALARARLGRFDLVIVDTLVGEPPQVIAGLYDRLGVSSQDSPLLLGVRLRGVPGDPALRDAARRTRYLQLWGAGAGDEPQTLYALLSPRPANIVTPATIAAFPIPLGFAAHEEPTVAAIQGTPAARRVTLLGYLIRAAEDGALCLDLPHQEMGAQRFRLRGDALATLEPLLPRDFIPMTAGEIRLDGDTSKTLREVLGGGGWMRSDVRFSPIVVGLTGVARVAAVVDPDAAPFVPPSLRGAAQTDPRLPYGGILYDLDVEAVTFTLDRPAWTRLRGKLTPLARKAAAALARGDLATAREHLGSYIARIDAAFPEHALRFAVRADMARAHQRLAGVTIDPPAKLSPVDRGRRCAALDDDGVFQATGNPDMDTLAHAVATCRKRLAPNDP